jgi:hypothetical protein
VSPYGRTTSGSLPVGVNRDERSDPRKAQSRVQRGSQPLHEHAAQSSGESSGEERRCGFREAVQLHKRRDSEDSELVYSKSSGNKTGLEPSTTCTADHFGFLWVVEPARIR